VQHRSVEKNRSKCRGLRALRVSGFLRDEDDSESVWGFGRSDSVSGWARGTMTDIAKREKKKIGGGKKIG